MEPESIDWAAALAALEKKRAVIDQAIAGIKILMGDSAAGLDSVGGQPAGTPKEQEINPGTLDSHAFFGMSVAAATQKYLNIKKKPASAAEIAEALQKGGFASQSENFGPTITTAMYRAKDIFVRVKRGLWGLKAWYPNYRAPKADAKGEE